VEEILKAQPCAAVILEPVVGNSGFIKPTQEFLEGLRELSTKYVGRGVHASMNSPISSRKGGGYISF